MTYDEWISEIFDNLAEQAENLNATEIDYIELPSAIMLNYLTETFNNAEVVFSRFTKLQVAHGLWAIVGNGTMLAIRDPEIPLSNAVQTIDSMVLLFEKYFSKHCTANYHFQQGKTITEPLDIVCYMWWDVLPMHGLIEHDPLVQSSPFLDQALLSAMLKILEIDSIACQVSALHGLEQWMLYYPELIETSIIEYIESDRACALFKLSPDLLDYAKLAMHR